jgi:23S rRNA (uridine2552-2'-O)-methyltransferase
MNHNLKVSKLNKLKKPLSHQSVDWVKKHLNDPFVRKARKEGYISRAAYKLLEIQDKYKLIKNNHNIVELGSAPGGWSQVTIDLL